MIKINDENFRRRSALLVLVAIGFLPRNGLATTHAHGPDNI